MPQVLGPLFENVVLPSPATASLAEQNMGTLEAELGFVLKAGLPPREAPYTEEEVWAATSKCTSDLPTRGCSRHHHTAAHRVAVQMPTAYRHQPQRFAHSAQATPRRGGHRRAHWHPASRTQIPGAAVPSHTLTTHPVHARLSCARALVRA